ncbi:transcription antitermination factor NusB [uncultured Desulfovibrio sp.]|uniref:Transcription antitermination protein NusB n=1 Tax=Candidatus Desulfovibrio intestinavium TaxID=2838534 RepID=A0A9D2HPD4_9BACT|nr:transcription antitermination factor NusB [uncultured Desulfovibrio sp.]HJA79358.1 transcription antitermination factor NusB [Candidatus Desulfovibrio intestinavium]
MSKAKNSSRRAERAQAFQVLYGLSFAAGATLRDVRRAFLLYPDNRDVEPVEDESLLPPPSGFAWELVQGVWTRAEELDQHLARFSRNWRVDRMGRVERTILRLAMFELLYRTDVPPRVTIAEALDLTRQFGEDNAAAFVNGILDAATKAAENGSLRPDAPEDGPQAAR